jgi:hypothetical protein
MQSPQRPLTLPHTRPTTVQPPFGLPSLCHRGHPWLWEGFSGFEGLWAKKKPLNAFLVPAACVFSFFAATTHSPDLDVLLTSPAFSIQQWSLFEIGSWGLR